MSHIQTPLESINIASPCNASWDAMQGDDWARFCATCHKHVYNLSEMSRTAAEALILENEGQLCVRFFQRARWHCHHLQLPRWLARGAASV